MGPCDLEKWTFCNDCNRWFLNQKCHDKHKVRKIQTVKKGNKKMVVSSSTCDNVTKCRGCPKTLQKWANYSDKHECGKVISHQL
jgi:hypothetical protein